MSKYINTDELIKAIEMELWDWETVDGIKSSTVLKQTISDIKNMPSADVRENIHGEWINKRTMQHDGEFYCSVCDFVLDTFMQGVFYNYCPNCGADMRKKVSD